MPDSELLKQLISTPSWSPSLQITLLFSLSMNRIISVHKISGKQNHIVFIWLISFILISSKFIFVAACARILVHFEGQEILCYVSVAHFLDPVGYRWIWGGAASTFWLFRTCKVPFMFLFSSFGQCYIPYCECYHTLLHSGCTIVRFPWVQHEGSAIPISLPTLASLLITAILGRNPLAF